MAFSFFNQTLLYIILQNQTSKVKQFIKDVPSYIPSNINLFKNLTDSQKINLTKGKIMSSFKNTKAWATSFGNNLSSTWLEKFKLNKNSTKTIQEEAINHPTNNKIQTINTLIHTKISNYKLNNWSYSIIPPLSLTKIKINESYPCLSSIYNFFNHIDRIYLIIYIGEIFLSYLLFVFIFKFIKKCYNRRQTKKIANLVDFFVNQYGISTITIIKSIDGYDKGIFEKQKHPEKNPSIYSSQYADVSAPKKFTNYDDAKKAAEKIYYIPAKYKHCLGGANLIMYASSAVLSDCNGISLYCPSVLGFIRNQSSKSIFNLVKTGVISMTPISVHSPGAVTITNNKNYLVKVDISKGTILEGRLPSQSPIFTTENVYVTLKAKESQNIKLNHKPLYPEYESTMWTCSRCNVSCAYPHHICPCNGNCCHTNYSCQKEGEYLATGFINPDAEPPKQDQPNKENEYSRVDESCNIWNDKLKNKKINKSCIAYRPLDFLKEMNGQEMKYAIHEANVVEIDGDYYLIEKMGPDSSSKNKNGYIDTRHCKVEGNNVISEDGKTLRINENWKQPSQTITGQDIWNRIQNNDAYSLGDKNCQDFARNLIGECNFSKPKAKNATLYGNAIIEALSISQGGVCDHYMYRNFGVVQVPPF